MNLRAFALVFSFLAIPITLYAPFVYGERYLEELEAKMRSGVPYADRLAAVQALPSARTFFPIMKYDWLWTDEKRTFVIGWGWTETTEYGIKSGRSVPITSTVVRRIHFPRLGLTYVLALFSALLVSGLPVPSMISARLRFRRSLGKAAMYPTLPQEPLAPVSEPNLTQAYVQTGMTKSKKLVIRSLLFVTLVSITVLVSVGIERFLGLETPTFASYVDPSFSGAVGRFIGASLVHSLVAGIITRGIRLLLTGTKGNGTEALSNTTKSLLAFSAGVIFFVLLFGTSPDITLYASLIFWLLFDLLLLGSKKQPT